ncbi:MAG: hypothetical protein JO197_16890 [Acidobacteria bacterium]|nr:hypothetical protein [Acidobacteriota bacterium]MBV9478500.1 hypothetical protein [Acidobacteriota bacterium]
MRRLLFLLAFVPTVAFAQRDWTSLPGSGCIGGSRCADRWLRIPIEDRPVIAVRFHASDNIGETAGGALRVKIDGNTITSYLDIARNGQTYTLDVDELEGRALIFEPAEKDEVQIDNIAVLYGRRTGGGGGVRPRDRDADRDPHARGWRSYPQAKLCIGGDECRKNGNRITIALDNAPVLGIRFWAHDNIGTRADGKLTVKIDDKAVASYVDVQRNGKRHQFDVDNIRGTRLTIATASDDEVEVSEIEVLYGARGSSLGHDVYGKGPSHYGPSEVTDEGGCIGGSQCGGRHARISIALHGRPVESIRFYARDDVGTRAGGRLRLRIDDELLESGLDVTREGRTITVDGHHIAGDFLVFEPAADDEIVLKDIRVRFVER